MKFPTGTATKRKLTSQLSAIPPGPEGVYITLRAMRDLTRQGKKNLDVRQKVMEITRRLPQKDWAGEVRAIHQYVRDNIRYIKDIRGVETLAQPQITLETGQGDCDDKSVLAASMLESIGHPTRFVAIGFSPRHYSHVYLETKIGNQWVSVECTEPVELGWQPKGVVSRMVIHN